MSEISAGAAEKKIVLEEQLNQKWTQELLGFPFGALETQCAPDSVGLLGPNGPVPVQLSNVQFWPGSQYVKSATVFFVVEALEPLATNIYKLSYGADKATATVPSDLKVTAGNGAVEITTSLIGARLLTGEKTYDQPVPAKDVPGPLLSMRLTDGTWTGGSRLYGDNMVKSWSAKVTESGPVFASVECRFKFSDGNTAAFVAEIVAGGNAVRWKTDISADQPETGVFFLWGKLPGVKEAIMLKGWGQWGRERTVLLNPGNEPFCLLSPNTSITSLFPDSPWAVRLVGEGGAEFQVRSRAAGAWVDPLKPLTYAGYRTWNMEMIPKLWEGWQKKRLPLNYGTDTMIGMKVDFSSGKRLWGVSNGTPIVGERLNVVKDYILKWPIETAHSHPHLFMSKADVMEAWKRATPDPVRMHQYLNADNDTPYWSTEGYLYSGGNKNAAAKLGQALRKNMALLGDFDTMRHGNAVAAMYDAFIDTDFVTPQERALYRAQLAYLGYRMADPEMWSMERGYLTGNPNMSVCYTLMQGIIACLIPNHPMAKTWAEYATGWMDKWLTEDVGPNGEWLPEGAHYNQVSITPMIAYAIAAKRAGFHDFLIDPRFKKLMLFVAKQFTPNDPRHNNERVSPPVGRGEAGESTAMFGVLARATAETDPPYSKIMRWMATQSGSISILGDWRMGGFESLYMNAKPPSRKPDWGSELFPGLGVVFRDGIGDQKENYLNILATTDSLQNLDVWVPGIGGIAQWFAFGKPVSEAFSFAVGYRDRHELLRDGVLLARNWGAPADAKTPFGYYTTTSFKDFAALPEADYVRATYRNTTADTRDWFPDKMPAWPTVDPGTEPTLEWTRQALFMKDDKSTGPHYLVLHDTTFGGQPTMWQFWSLSEKIGTPEQTRDLTAFLADKPGFEAVSAHELPPGNRYTAIGQFGVDLEFFIASPTNTPRSTLRYGGEYKKVSQFQDLLHLQLPGDGAYYVAIFPRDRTEAAPVFTTVGSGKIIKVAGNFGTDYCFLAKEIAEEKVDDISFKGTAAVAQKRAGGLVLGLLSAGEVSYGDFGLSAPIPASLRVNPASLIVTLSEPLAGGKVVVYAPGDWSLQSGQTGVSLAKVPKGYAVTIPAGQHTSKLTKNP